MGRGRQACGTQAATGTTMWASYHAHVHSRVHEDSPPLQGEVASVPGEDEVHDHTVVVHLERGHTTRKLTHRW